MLLIDILEKRIKYLEELCQEQEKYIQYLEKQNKELLNGLSQDFVRVD